jgi:hypothetical protein
MCSTNDGPIVGGHGGCLLLVVDHITAVHREHGNPVPALSAGGSGVEESSIGVTLTNVFEFASLFPICSTLADEQSESLLAQEAKATLTS